MTELETQLLEALKGLSAQYAQEQQRQAGQIEALQQQVTGLQQQLATLQPPLQELTGQLTQWHDYFTHLAPKLKGLDEKLTRLADASP